MKKHSTIETKQDTAERDPKFFEVGRRGYKQQLWDCTNYQVKISKMIGSASPLIGFKHVFTPTLTGMTSQQLTEWWLKHVEATSWRFPGL